jgi:hypothetical protein
MRIKHKLITNIKTVWTMKVDSNKYKVSNVNKLGITIYMKVNY